MIIDRTAYDVMIEHMRQAAPREGVGLLAGLRNRPEPPGGQWQTPSGAIVDRWVPLTNVSDFPRLRYEVDSDELIAAWEALEGDGRRPWIVCHSHVTTGTAPSPVDVRYAVDRTLLHLIVSLAGSQPAATLWQIDPDARPGTEKMIRYQVVDLGFQAISPTDLTHGVTRPSV